MSTRKTRIKKRNMKTTRFAIITLLLASGMVFAAEQIDRTAEQPEKVKANLQAVEAAKKKAVQYTPLLQEGSENGAPYALRCTDLAGKKVYLTWLSPEPVNGYYDDFEAHEDFAINSAGNIGWSYVDGDNQYNYTWAACNFPNMGQKMAFIVMNPSQTSPATDSNPNYKPYSGEKMLVDFCADNGQNNDYIISPQLKFDEDFTISFQARSYNITSTIPMERIRVGYSVKSMRPSDFVFVNEGDYVELPAQWTLLQYSIPKDAKYVCINSVSQDAFMLMIDDIYIGTNRVRPGIAPMRAADMDKVTGFNIYRNGEKVNETPVNVVRYTDEVPDYATYDYTVTAVLADGSESVASEVLQVEVPDTRLLPFEDDFESWTLDSAKWECVNLAGETSRWKVDYKVYGLVDAAATYGWSIVTDYNDALSTRELKTSDRNNTWLRFNLQLDNEKVINVDALYIEVTSDDGITWKQVARFDNREGEYSWRQKQYDLSSMLDSDLFKVRFRVKGTSAYYIDYWYVDDVKVWNPDWSKATVNVKKNGTPVAGCTVKMNSVSGGESTYTTDENGTIQIEQLEKDTILVQVEVDGCNYYCQKWTALDENNVLDINLTAPQVSLSTTDIVSEQAAESKSQKQFTLTNSGTGDLKWTLAQKPAQASSSDLLFTECTSWTTSGDLQNGIVFDGEYYYTTSSVYLNKFWKYDRTGKLVEQFYLENLYYHLYNVTYDGRYFYASDGLNRIFKMDFDQKRVIDVITVTEQPDLKIYHCTWDPKNKGFWVGSTGNIVLIGTNGKQKTKLTSFSETESVAVVGSAYDDVTPGGPYLWLADETAANNNMLDCIMLRQYNLNTMTLTDVKHVLNDVPGYVVGNASMGRNYVCGIYASPDINKGRMTLIGVLQQSPTLIFNYTLAETTDWMDFSPHHGILAAGEQQTFTVNYDALKLAKDETRTASALLTTVPDVGDYPITFTLKATETAAYPRPQSLQATTQGTDVALTWQAGNATRQPQGYEVWRNGERIATGITSTAYNDEMLVRGTYTYKVKAVYGENLTSEYADSVVAKVVEGSPFYAPISLTAECSDNRHVALNWLSPLAHAAEPDTMSWAGGAHDDQVGISEGAYFYAAHQYTPDDLVPYRNKKIRAVGVQLVNPITYLALYIIKNDTTIYKQVYDGDILYDGTLTEVTLDQPLAIDANATYLFAFQIMHDADIQPLGIDQSTTTDGKGNLLSEDGTEWFTALNSGINGNFNISVLLDGADANAETAPVGYIVYRNGVALNDSPVTATAYDDEVNLPGTHTYSVASVYADNRLSAKSTTANVEIVDIGTRTATPQIETQVTVNRNVALRWDYPSTQAPAMKTDLHTMPATVKEGLPEYVNTFEGTASEMAIGSDGKYIYTSDLSQTGGFLKYSMDGSYIERFQIDGLDAVRNIAWTGTAFYVSDNDNNIKLVNMDTRKVEQTIDISEYARHLTYSPALNNGKGGFVVGDWETSIIIATDGSKLADGPALLGASGTACVGHTLYAFEQGGKANAHTLGVYDLTTGKRTATIDLDEYLELTDIEGSVAGGASVIDNGNGTQLLALALQRKSGKSRFVFLEASGVAGVKGYNIYRDGALANSEMLTHRYYDELIQTPGTYSYQVQTVYIDNEVSALSAPAEVTILQPDEARQPADVKAEQMSAGYNVQISFANPYRYDDAATAQDFEAMEQGSSVNVEGWSNDKWTVTDTTAYDGNHAMTAAQADEATLIIPAAGMGCLQMAMRNLNERETAPQLQVLYSETDDHLANFIPLTYLSTAETWSDKECLLPEGTQYIALRKAAGSQPLLIDALRLYATAPAQKVYGYDVYRNGKKINDQLITATSYTDRNLMPDRYAYRVRLTTMLSAESELSDEAVIDLNYDCKSLPVTGLKATLDKDDHIQLSWQRPAIDEPIYLRWHDGNCADAGGMPSGGGFFAAVRWLSTDLKNYDKLAITDVEVFINQVPDALYVLVYEGNELVYQQYVPKVYQLSFNTIHLNKPIMLNVQKDLKVAVYVEHNENTVPLGYDAGPAVSGLGDLYSTDGSTWTTLGSSDTGIDGNWNISVGLSPYLEEESTAQAAPAFAPALTMSAKKASAAEMSPMLKTQALGSTATSVKNVLKGYNIYRNDERLNEETITVTQYYDTKAYTGSYLKYKVSAEYTVAGEVMSDAVTVATAATGIDGVKTDSRIKVTIANGILTVRGAHSGESITVYGADGSMMVQGKAGENYVTTMPVGNTAGTCIIRVGDQVFKTNR